MPAVANAIAADLAAVQPNHASYFKANAAAFINSLTAWDNAIAAFKAKYPGTPVATGAPPSICDGPIALDGPAGWLARRNGPDTLSLARGNARPESRRTAPLGRTRRWATDIAALYPGDDILVMVGDGEMVTGLMGLSLSVWMVRAAL